MTCTLQGLYKDFETQADAGQAVILQRFFKTGKGQYGQGDIFLGLKVPVQRKIAKQYRDLPINDVIRLLQSKIHEHRLTALLILILQYQKADDKTRKIIFNLYFEHRKWINNWDLVDLSAPNIVGNYLLDKEREVLYKLAQSKNLWDKRIAILATFEFIKAGDAKDTFHIVEILLNDSHDLIHKAAGWMLREVGKRIGQATEETFLKKHHRQMPRTMLRYAIEHFSPTLKKKYMAKNKTAKKRPCRLFP
ncbi:MAG: DNA alkylation repair protein [Planctomycetes bacterium]|nr:DNA alkylation repair protein [Planctomycetota bacterium]